MSFIYSRLWSQPATEGEDRVDFTCSRADRSKLVRDIKLGGVKQIKAYLKDFHHIRNNLYYLTDSLVDLRIRPRQHSTDDSEQGVPDRQSPTGCLAPLLDKENVDCLQQFVKLQHFSLENDGSFAAGLLMSVSKLSNLVSLKLQSCGIRGIDVKLPPCLEHVDASSNQLTTFPRALLKLKQLEIVILCRNYISELPDEISHLKQLKKLDISNNTLAFIPNSIVNMENLIKLYMTDNKIKELPLHIGQLKTLKHLELRGNQINSLPDSIGDLYKLMKLNLCNNKLTALPESICDLSIDDDALLFSGNPLQLPPAEICMQGRQAMKGYFDAMKKSKGVKCKRLKLILVGEARAGKSSLAHALVHKKDAKIAPDKRTVGIDFHKWRPNPQQEDGIEIRLIDCAGQRKYLLTHQFFFTEGAIFLLVVDLSSYRTVDSTYKVMVGDWISLIINNIPGAVIMIAPTHLDVCKNQGEDVHEKCNDILQRVKTEEQNRVKFLENEYIEFLAEGKDMAKIKNIEYLKCTRPHLPSCLFIEDHITPDISLTPVCCKEALEGIDKLEKEILRIAGNVDLCPIVNKEVPESWVRLEKRLMNMKSYGNTPFIELDVLFDLTTEECDLDREMFHSALLYLDAIGSVAYFSYVERASHLVFIDHEWLINLLRLLFRHDHQQKLHFKDNGVIFYEQFEQDKELFIRQGHLSKALLCFIWFDVLGNNDSNVFSCIVELLHYFDIICELPYKNEFMYFIPWFVDEEEPEAVNEYWTQHQFGEDSEEVIFRITTCIAQLPLSIFERLLVFVHERSRLCIPWKSGFLVTKQKYKLLCNVRNESETSSVVLHGRCCHDCTSDLWLLILMIWKEFDILIKEWSGIIIHRVYSVCPLCVGSKRQHPYMFRFDYNNNDFPSDSFPCHKCQKFLDQRLMIPPKEIFDKVFKEHDDTEEVPVLADPLSDAELSDLAVMLGVRHTRFALLLELSQNDVEVARANYQNSQYEQAMELLFKWKKREGNANRSKLINAAMKLTDPSEDVIRFLKFGKR